jgi:succinoglycan biosynthesis transport protein ExoP
MLDATRNLDTQGQFVAPHATIQARNSVDLPELFWILRRNLWIIIASVVLSAAIGAGYVLTTPTTFVASAQVLIEPQRPQLFWQEPGMLDLTIDNAQVESQVEILRSDRMTSVIRDLELTNDPEFYGEEKPSSESNQLRVAIAAFNQKLSVRRLGQSYVIEIAFRSEDPAKAALVANAVADAYIRDQLEAKSFAARRGSVWLEERIAELRVKLGAAASAVHKFKTENRIIETGNESFLDDQQLTQMNSRLVAEQAETAEARARLSRIEEVLSSDSPGAAVSEVLNNAVITDLRQRFLDAAAKESELSVRYGPDHPSTVSFRNKMRVQERAILDELRRIGEIYRSEYEIAKSREEAIGANVQNLVRQTTTREEAAVTLAELESSEQAYRRMYESFLEKLTETIQQQSFPISDARVIMRAAEPMGKSSPKTKLIMALAILVGGFVGVSTAVARSAFDRRIRSAQQIRDELGLNCLGTLPRFRKSWLRSGSGSYEQVVEFPLRRYSDSLRGVKTFIEIARVKSSIRCIGIVPTFPAEGASTVAGNLAALFAASGSRTLLIDGDLRQATLTKALAPSAKTGLLEVLGADPLNIKVVASAQFLRLPTKVNLLPAVSRKPVASSSDLLGSERMRLVLEQLREFYDIIIVDLPPLTTVVDARAISPFLDAVVLMAEWSRTPLDKLMQSAESIDSAQARVLGVVINKAR